MKRSPAYRAGLKAKALGFRRSDNPYAPGTRQRTDWRTGWDRYKLDCARPKCLTNS